MLSMHDSEQYLFEALKAGASGYVLKTAANRDLVDAVRARAMRGEAFLYPAATAALVRDHWIERARAPARMPEDPLTTRASYEVLQLIAEAHTNDQIARDAGDRETDGRAPPCEHPRQAAHARPRRADALRDPPRARSALSGGGRRAGRQRDHHRQLSARRRVVAALVVAAYLVGTAASRSRTGARAAPPAACRRRARR